MKKAFVWILCCLIGYVGHTQKKWVEDANVEPRELTGSFHTIQVSGAIRLYISQSDEDKMAVSASDARMISQIKTTVDAQTLKIYYEGDLSWNKKKRSITVYVSFKDLRKIVASGATDIRAEGLIDVPSLDIQISGASNFRGTVSAKDCQLELSGASDIIISGKTDSLQINSSGASDVKGYELETAFCEAKASGASDIRITVQKELKANASGASSIFYRGSASITDIHTSGASTIIKKSD